jgi:predicted patatin/cPLA2 family phospholipase
MSSLVGTHPEAVLQLMHDRRRIGYTPGSPSPRKLALIVEGGGMRGVLSAGSLLALDLMGFRACVDEIYANSAGGVNAAYFLSGQGILGIKVYFDLISNRKFINPWRILKIADIDFVYDHIVPQVRPLDEAAVRSSPTRFLLSTTEIRSGRNVLIDARKASEPIAHILKASSALPVLYNKTVPLAGGLYVDGGLSDALPVRQAIAAGCTDILVLATQLGHASRPSLLESVMLYARMGRRYPNVMRAHWRSFATDNENRRIANGFSTVPGVHVATICPSPIELEVGPTTLTRTKLIAAAHAMAHRTYCAFDGPLSEIHSVFGSFAHSAAVSARRGP